MEGLEVTVLLGLTILVGTLIAPRVRLALPLVLVLLGLLLGFVPELREVQLPPETVLLLFLPVILFWESLTTSLRSSMPASSSVSISLPSTDAAISSSRAGGSRRAILFVSSSTASSGNDARVSSSRFHVQPSRPRRSGCRPRGGCRAARIRA